MNKNVVKNILYIVITAFISLIILLTRMPDYFIYTVIYLAITFYLSFNYFKNVNYPYLRQLYILWILITILYYIFSFSLLSIVLSIFIGLLLVVQFLLVHKKKEKVVVQEQIKVNVDSKPKPKIADEFDQKQFEKLFQKLYINMQTYFMNFEYEKLKGILTPTLYAQYEKQMLFLQKNKSRAIRKNIEFISFEIKNIKDNEIIVNIGVCEDKYTQKRPSEQRTLGIRYESYYEVKIIKKDKWLIDKLNLVYSHSAKKS